MSLKFYKSASVAALMGAFGAITVASPVVQAQEDAEMEEVVVSGFRQSLEAALDRKRDEVGAVDAILAEDIADFPDNNLAESLQRVPGVVIDRAGGEGRNVSVRGLGSNFTRTTINGMEVLASSGFTDALGGATRGRGFDYNTFDSNLFRSVMVRKTNDAQTEEGSLGATIGLQSTRPFDLDGFALVASGQLGYNDQAEEADPKISVLISNTFADGTVGLLASLAYSERNLVEEGASSVRWNTANNFGSYQGGALPAELVGASKPRLPRYDYYQHEIERTGANFAVQFAPVDAVQLSLDVLYSKHDAFRDERFIQGILNSNDPVFGNGVINVQDYEVDQNGTILYASLENGRIHSESRQDEMTTEFNQYTLSGEFELADAVRLKGLVGSAESEFDNPVQTSLNLLRNGVNWSYDYRNGRVPDFNFGPASEDTSGWAAASIRLRPLTADNTFDTVAVDLEWDLSDALTFKAGVSAKSYEFVTTESRRPASAGGEDDAGITNVDPSVMEILDGGNASWATVNFDAFLAEYNVNDLALAPFQANTWGVEEDTSSIYVQLDFEGSIGDVPVRGNVGVRQVETEQSSVSFGSGSLASQLLTGSHTYDEMLPSLNLVWETSEDILIRFGWAKSIARAGLGSLRPNVSVNASGGARTVAGGNPALEPTQSKNYDLAIEYYFAEESLFSMAVFHKDIESFVQTIGGDQTFASTGLDPQIAIDACAAAAQSTANCGPNTIWSVSSPVNGPGGDLYGFEVSYQQPFSFLPGFWSNFGVLANFTYVKSQLDYVNNAGVIQRTEDLLNLSETSYNATLYYEDDVFSARLSFVNRSGYLTLVSPMREGNNLEGTHGTHNVDFAAALNVSDQLKLTFEGQNLTNEADDQWVDQTADRPSYFHQSGTTYYFGVRYSY